MLGAFGVFGFRRCSCEVFTKGYGACIQHFPYRCNTVCSRYYKRVSDGCRIYSRALQKSKTFKRRGAAAFGVLQQFRSLVFNRYSRLCNLRKNYLWRYFVCYSHYFVSHCWNYIFGTQKRPYQVTGYGKKRSTTVR